MQDTQSLDVDLYKMLIYNWLFPTVFVDTISHAWIIKWLHILRYILYI
jgi:hypothetical protein